MIVGDRDYSFAELIYKNLTLGYPTIMPRNEDPARDAARIMGLRSAEARRKQWGEKEFIRRMKAWSKRGGRPKGTQKKTKGGN